MKKILITCALPYVNNIPHLGNMLQGLSADVFARYCRLRGYETLFVGGTDEYGTATETRALKEKVSPRELCDRYHAVHRRINDFFELSYDIFGRTSTPQQTKIVQNLFKAVDKAGYIKEKESEQLYCPTCQRFLADRYVEGTCPHCGYEHARGDQCDNCQTLLDPTELKNPQCGVCGSTPVLRKTKHLYIDLPKAVPMLNKWIDKASVEGFWSKNALQITKGWIKDGLRERCITRDLKWGIPVPKPGYEDKVFYVWFDAPIGYISITSCLEEDWEKKWWKNPDVRLFQFMGKDNIPFHTVIFPATLLSSGEKWTMLYHMSSTEYLNYEGGKFSKSNGVGVFGTDVEETGIPADIWRFYLMYNRPEHSDVLFTWSSFMEKVNGELIGNLSNLVNRTLVFVKRSFNGDLSSASVDMSVYTQIKEYEHEIEELMEKVEERDALLKILELSAFGNRVFQHSEPWKNPKESKNILKTLVCLIRDLGVMISPYMPETGKKILGFLNCEGSAWSSVGCTDKDIKVVDSAILFEKLSEEKINSLRARFSPDIGKNEADNKNNNKEVKRMNELNNAEDVVLEKKFSEKVILKVAKIKEVNKHPEGDFLYILTLDAGEEEDRIIVSSIVPYYTPEQLSGRNIVLVSNLKPANFRGVKSRGMLLAAQDKDAQEHTTCEVLFADNIKSGTILEPEGYSVPENSMCYVKPDTFFSMPLYMEAGVLKINGKKILSPSGDEVHSVKYKNGPVG